MTVGIIVQARMASTRLPGKVLADIGGRPMLAWQLERLKRVKLADRLVVAVPFTNESKPILSVAYEAGADVIGGSEDDVLARYLRAANARGGIDTVVRVTADCPLIDPETVDALIATFDNGPWAYGILDGVPDGMEAEIVQRETLEMIYPYTNAEEREHVTLHLRRNPGPYLPLFLRVGVALAHERWCVDTPADLEMVRRVFAHFGSKPFTLADVWYFLADHPEVRALNAHIPKPQREIEVRPRDFAPMLGDL